MKIFYAVQATGNGHISRAMELLPHLQKYGSVDIFLSGENSNLTLDAPIKFRSKGISLFYNCNGSLDYWEMLKKFQPLRVKQEIHDLPVEKYDLVLNDFEYITSAACVRKKIPSIHFGHQASFQSLHTPRPLKKNSTGEWLLKKYIKAEHHVGLHFKKYDDFIFTAIVKEEILKADPLDLDYYTVYLPSYCEKQLVDIFSHFIDFKFQIFSKKTSQLKTIGNITFIPVNKQLFNQSLINSSGIISGGGFETPAEALHLGKKIMVIPIRGQYEQLCNTEALSRLGITCLSYIGRDFAGIFYEWVQSSTSIQIDYSDSIPECLNHILSIVESLTKFQSV